MKICRNCGEENPERAKFCRSCGQAMETDSNYDRDSTHSGLTRTLSNISDKATDVIAHRGDFLQRIPKKTFYSLAAVFVVGVIVIIFLAGYSGKCQYPDCHNKAVSGSRYCYSHKCAISYCDNMRKYGSNYCYTHSKSYDDDDSENDYSDLSISGVEVTSSSTYSYKYADGIITNNGNHTVTFVKIKGAFTNSSGKVIDTDWTYAVGSEGLAPGESCKWHLSVSYDSSITKCRVTIIDD